MNNIIHRVFAFCALSALVGCGGVVFIDETSGAFDGSDTSTSSGATSSSSSSSASASSSSSSSVGSGGGTSSSSSSVGGGASASSSSSSGTGGGIASVATLSLASNPASGTLVKKAQNANAMGITVTVGAKPMTLKSVTLTGQAVLAGANCSFGQQCAREAFSQRVVSMAIFNGTTQVGWAKAPDTMTGKAEIPNVNLAIAAGTTAFLTVKISLGSTASLAAPYDQIAVGIEQQFDATFEDEDDNLLLGTINNDLTGQLWTMPQIIQTIRPKGEVAITLKDTPVSNIVIGGKNAWVPFTQFEATAQYEDAIIDRQQIFQVFGDNADFTAIAVASEGMVHGQDILPATGPRDVDLSASPIVVHAGTSKIFQIWGKLANVVSSSAVNGAWTGVPRSGHAPALGLSFDITTGEWDANYVGMFNSRMTGVSSGERLYATKGVASGFPMVLRKSQPIVTKQALSSTTLANVDQDFFKFQVAADSAGPIALKSFKFHVVRGGDWTMDNFRLRRGTTDMDPSQYGILLNCTPFGCGLTATPSMKDFEVTVIFTDEETVQGSGNVYTLHGTNSGVTSGCTLVTSMQGAHQDMWFVTGQLFLAYPTYVSITGGDPMNQNEYFVWSDLSEVPHSAGQSQIQSPTSSADWTNAALVQDLTSTQVLTN